VASGLPSAQFCLPASNHQLRHWLFCYTGSPYQKGLKPLIQFSGQAYFCCYCPLTLSRVFAVLKVKLFLSRLFSNLSHVWQREQLLKKGPAQDFGEFTYVPSVLPILPT